MLLGRRFRALRACLRVARRELARNKVRSAILIALVALPVWLGGVVALVTHNSRNDSERLAQQEIGTADALLVVTRHPEVDVTYPDGSTMDARPVLFEVRDGKRRPTTRDPRAVDLADFLPAGTRMIPAPVTGDVDVATGGTGQVTEVALEDPLTRGIFEIDRGRAPSDLSEVAVTALMADEFGWLDANGRPRSDARITLAEGRSLDVVGILADTRSASDHPAQLVAVPRSGLLEHAREPTLLLDLPSGIEGPRLNRLVEDLAANGLALMPRDVFLDPHAWGADLGEPPAIDPRALAAGAITVAVSAAGIVVIVGGAFAVGARRRVRDLGTLMAAGSSPSDIRLLVMAEGALLGLVAALTGVCSAILTFWLGAPSYSDLTGVQVWDRDPQVLTMSLLGLGAVVTAILASAPPSWTAGRLMPVAARGSTTLPRAPRTSASRAGGALAAVGLILLGVAGMWIAEAFDSPAMTPARAVLAPITVGVAGFLALVASAVLLAPQLVRAAGLSQLRFPVTWRVALRDADRHRARTVAAALAVAMAVAMSVLIGFAIQGAGALVKSDPNAPPRSVLVYLDDGTQTEAAAGSRLAQTLNTLDSIVGTGQTLIAYRPQASGRGEGTLAFDNGEGFTIQVRVVEPEALATLLGRPDPEAARVLSRGGLVTSERPGAAPETVSVATVKENRPGRPTRLTVAWARDQGIAGTGDIGTAWVSPETARGLGLQLISTTMFRQLTETVTTEELSRLELRGINAVAPDAEFAWLPVVSAGAVASAGLLSLLVAGTAIALSSADGRGDAATMAAVGASPSHQRRMGTVHGLLIGAVGTALGLMIGVPSGSAFGQLDGASGLAIPAWTWLVAVALPVLTSIGGYLVVPTRLRLTRRVG